MVLNMKNAGWLLLAVVIAVVVWLLLRPTVINVQIGTVAPRTLTVTVTEQGRTRARDPFIIGAPITGRLLRPELEVGDQVKGGQVIARVAVSPTDRKTEAVAQANLAAAQARQKAAAATLAEAETALSRARSEEERRGELFKKKLTSREELEYYGQVTDAAQARVQSLQASLQAAVAEVDSARSLLLGSSKSNNDDAGILNVAAPVEGTVYHIYEESERVVQAGSPLYAISRDNVLEIIVDVLTQDAVQIAPGQPLRISGWGGGEVLNGNVMRVEPQAFTKISALGVEEQRVNVIGSLPVMPPQLGAEYRVDVSIVVWEQADVLTLPASALFQRNGHWNTFVVEAGKAHLRQLETGRRNREWVQVVDGLKAGEQVIMFPSDLVTDGAAVAVAD